MIRKIIILIAFALGAVFMAYNPQYTDFVKEKWEDTKESSEKYIDDLKDGAKDMGSLSE